MVDFSLRRYGRYAVLFVEPSIKPEYMNFALCSLTHEVYVRKSRKTESVIKIPNPPSASALT